MHVRDYYEIAGGVALMAVGAFAALYSLANYDQGSLARMGPGYLPFYLGLLLAGFGFLIVLFAWLKTAKPEKIQWRSFLAVTASLVAFPLLLGKLGLLLSTFLVVLLATLASSEFTLKSRLLTALGVTVVTWLVFVVGLRISLPTWPVVAG